MSDEVLGVEAIHELVDLLQELTDGGALEWRTPGEGAGALFEFETDIGEYNVDLKSADGDGERPHVLRVFQNLGAEALVVLNSRVEPEWSRPLNDLYRSAKRQAFRVDTKIAPLISELRKLREP